MKLQLRVLQRRLVAQVLGGLYSPCPRWDVAKRQFVLSVPRVRVRDIYSP